MFNNGDATSYHYSNTIFKAGTWYHFVYTFNAGESLWYINGISSDSTGVPDATNADTTADLITGGTNQRYGNKFNGKLKDVKLFNEAKSADWAKAEYDSKKRFY